MNPPEKVVLPTDQELVLKVITMPADCNANGDIFGGWVMAQVRKLPQIENNMKIEASISLRRRDEEVKVHGEPDCCNLG